MLESFEQHEFEFVQLILLKSCIINLVKIAVIYESIVYIIAKIKKSVPNTVYANIKFLLQDA